MTDNTVLSRVGAKNFPKRRSVRFLQTQYLDSGGVEEFNIHVMQIPVHAEEEYIYKKIK